MLRARITATPVKAEKDRDFASARRLLLVKYSAADHQEATAPTIDSSFVLPESQPTPSVIRDMVGNHQYPQLRVVCRLILSASFPWSTPRHA